MTPETKERPKPWLEFHLEKASAELLKDADPSKVALEEVEGEAAIRMTRWNPQAPSIPLIRSSNDMRVKNVVLIEVVDGLCAAVRGLFAGAKVKHDIHLAGTPLELEMQQKGEKVDVRLLDFVNYGDHGELLGDRRTRLRELALVSATAIDEFIRQIVESNPHFASDPRVESLRNDSRSILALR